MLTHVQSLSQGPATDDMGQCDAQVFQGAGRGRVVETAHVQLLRELINLKTTSRLSNFLTGPCRWAGSEVGFRSDPPVAEPGRNPDLRNLGTLIPKTAATWPRQGAISSPAHKHKTT